MDTGENDPKKGRREAHTAAAVGGNPPSMAGAIDPRPLVEGLKATMEAEAGHQPGLFDEEEPTLPDTLAIGGTRSRLDAPRGRGRPLGAGNKRSELLREQLLKLGFQHPMVVLAGIASATVEEVATEIAGGEVAYRDMNAKGKVAVRNMALSQISGAASALLPYFESKRPQEIHVEETKRALFLVGRIDATAPGSSALSLGGENGNPFAFQQLSETDDLRTVEGGAHDTSQRADK